MENFILEIFILITQIISAGKAKVMSGLAGLNSGTGFSRCISNFSIICKIRFEKPSQRSEQKPLGVVEMVTSTFDGSRSSYPVEFFYDGVACEAGCTEDLAECIIQCRNDNACISDCNRAYSDCLNSLC